MADVESLQLQITGDAKSAKDSLDALIKTLGRLKTATKGGCGLPEVSKGLKDVDEKSKKTSSSNSKSAKSFVNLGAKVTAAALALKKAGKIVASWIKESNDYVENMNLFTVAMGEYADSAKQYAEEVSDLMGIDPSDWMRNQGVFMTLATGFGVAGDRAAMMSQQLTQLGYDISSFYNTSVEEAMQRLQSGISGEIEPLRRLGYDLSQAKLEATALSLGIDKAVSSMTQAEKSELRYYAIMTQVTTAQGDMARTLDAPANQLRVLSAQATQAARALGDLFIPALNAILPVATAVLKVITALAKIIARLFGADVQEGISSSMGCLASNAGDASDAIDDATDSAKKLKKMLLGIDELNVMSDASSGNSADDALGGGFNFELPTYDFIGELTETRVAQIVEDMKEWLGITDDINSWAELMDTRFGSILKTVGLIGTGLAAWKIFALIDGLKNSKLAEIFADTGKLKTGGGVIMGAVGAVMQLMGAWDAWQNGLDWKSLGEQLAGIGMAIGGLAIATGHIGAGIASIIGGLILTVTSIKDWIENGVDWDNFVGVMVGLAAIFGGISVLVGSWIPMAIGAVVATVVGIVMWWDQISAFFVKLWTSISNWCGEAWNAVAGFFTGIWTDITTFWNSIPGWFDVNVIQPVTEFFRGLWKSVVGFFSSMWADIVAIWNSIPGWFSEKVVQPIVGFFTGLWEGIAAGFVSVATWFDTHLIQPVVNAFAALWERISTIFAPVVEWFSLWFGSVYQTISDIVYDIGVIVTGCCEIIKAAWAIVVAWFSASVIQPVATYFKTKWEEITTWVVNAWENIKQAWASACEWFDATFVQPVATYIREMWDDITTWATETWENIKLCWIAASEWVDTKIVQPVTTFFQNMWAGITSMAVQAWTDITTFAVNAWSGLQFLLSSGYAWIDGKIIQPLRTLFSNLWNGFLEKASLAWEGVKNVFGKAASFFHDTFQKAWAGIVKVFSVAGEIFVEIKDGIISAFKTVVNGLIRGLNSVIAIPFNGINTALSKIRDISIFGLTPFTSLRTISIPTIPQLADGGVVAAGQMFVANEAGPELVGNVGNRTAVVNNDQIVESVSRGVYKAVAQAMGQSGGTQVVEAKINDKVLFEVVVDRNRRETMRTGYSPLLGGV